MLLKKLIGLLTGEFPKGKINDQDQEELNIGIAIDPKRNLVVINFGVPIVWAALEVDDAMALGLALISNAAQIESEQKRRINADQETDKVTDNKETVSGANLQPEPSTEKNS